MTYPSTLLFHMSFVRLRHSTVLERFVNVERVPAVPKKDVATVHILTDGLCWEPAYAVDGLLSNEISGASTPGCAYHFFERLRHFEVHIKTLKQGIVGRNVIEPLK